MVCVCGSSNDTGTATEANTVGITFQTLSTGYANTAFERPDVGTTLNGEPPAPGTITRCSAGADPGVGVVPAHASAVARQAIKIRRIVSPSRGGRVRRTRTTMRGGRVPEQGQARFQSVHLSA